MIANTSEVVADLSRLATEIDRTLRRSREEPSPEEVKQLLDRMARLLVLYQDSTIEL